MRRLLICVVVLLAAVTLQADKPAGGMKEMKHKMFQSVSVEQATLLQRGDAKMFCPQCGMNLPMFYKTNHVAEVDGKTKQYCSLHCLVEDKEINHKTLKNIRVVDVTTLQFIPVEKAFYVVGSDVKGTMSMTSKYAFGTREAADAFAKAHGGKVTDFRGAYEAAKADFGKDTAMISRKQTMMARKGEMLYHKRCKPVDKKFTSPAEAKAYIVKNGLCEWLNGKQLQAAGLYLSGK
jgi:nitrous oxide reductase accessory protein NosL